MKTTENISLGGYAFTIETNAYEELDAYLKAIRAGFSPNPSADEIIADIEERIAELLKEQTVPGMVINQQMISDIRKCIGNPSELAQEDDEPHDNNTAESIQEEQTQKKSERRGKRLYRDVSSRVFGGVCSGLGAYFGIDSVLIRIIFLILFMVGLIGIDEGPYIFFSVATYIGLWIAMPAARTDEQKREMRGKPIGLRDYKEKDFDFEKEFKDAAQSPGCKGLKRVLGIFSGSILLLAGIGGLLGAIFIPTMPELIGSHTPDYIFEWSASSPEGELGTIILTSTTFWILVLVMLGTGCVGMIYGAVMLLFGLKTPSWKPGLIIFIAWIMSIFTIIGWVAFQVAEALPGLINSQI